VHVNTEDNQVTVRRAHGKGVTYDPRRLQGVTLYRETDRAFARGDRVQLTAPDRERHLANRELGTIESMPAKGDLRLRLDSGRTVALDSVQSDARPFRRTCQHQGGDCSSSKVLLIADSPVGRQQEIKRRFLCSIQ
jgi:hypothetical protein